MSKTIEEQVEEFWSKFHSHSMASAADGDEVTDWLTQTLQERDRIAREEAIKECEGAAFRRGQKHFLKNVRKLTPVNTTDKIAYIMFDEVGEVDWEKVSKVLPRANITSDKPEV